MRKHAIRDVEAAELATGRFPRGFPEAESHGQRSRRKWADGMSVVGERAWLRRHLASTCLDPRQVIVTIVLPCGDTPGPVVSLWLARGWEMRMGDNVPFHSRSKSQETATVQVMLEWLLRPFPQCRLAQVERP